MTFGGLFQLQTLAKEVPGQTLADFVNYRSERLKQLPTTNDCYRYLKKLITDGIDAKHLYNQRLKKEHNTKRRQQRNEAASNRSAWCQKMHGKIIVNPKTNVALKINANYGLLEAEDRNSKNQTIKITGSLIKALDAGRLIVRQEQAVDKEVASRHLNAIYSKLPWLRLKKNLSIPQIS